MTYTFKLARRMASNHVVVVALVATLAACGNNTPTGPTPAPNPPAPLAGWLTIQLKTPHTNDGAVQITVTGPSVEEVAVPAPLSKLSLLREGAADIIIMGAITEGVVAKIRVADVRRSPQYVVTVQAAAARATCALQDLTAYRAALVR